MKVTVLLQSVFSSFGYGNRKQHIALTKLLAYRNCFDLDEYKDKLITDEEANTLLEKSFDSIEAGIAWLCDVAQKKWLRASFQREGISKSIDPVVNVERWQILNESVSASQEAEFLSIFKTLGLVDSVDWPEEPVKHVVVHGGLENIVKERISFLKDFSGTLYYMSNPRGLFNNEASVAPILAHWFGKPDLELAIQEVLDKNKDLKTSDKHWLKDLKGLKKDILEATGEIEWPVKGWYYNNHEPFDQAARSDGRHSLAGWPTAMDMVEYLIEQEKTINSEKFVHIRLLPVYSVRPGRVANTEDNIEDFYRNHAQHFPENTSVVFVSNNSIGLHYIPFQDVIAKETFKRLGAQQLHITTVGAGANKINLSAATDVYAKIFYSKRPGIISEIQAAKELPSVADTQYARMFIQPTTHSGASTSTSEVVSIPKNQDIKPNF